MRAGLFLIAWLSATTVADGRLKNRWIAWNVGQGLWTTARVDRTCFHFDTGGERWPMRALGALCGNAENRVTLSHSDWDHVGGLKALSAKIGRTCLIAGPREKVKSARKKKLWADLPACAAPENIDELHWSAHGRSTNSASRVFVFQKRFVIPGDSPASEEKAWSRSPVFRNAEVLVLGHHGSRTSTSDFLLGQAPRLKIAIASARRKKYGHPHAETIERLRRHHVGLLRTEDWGHLIFEL